MMNTPIEQVATDMHRANALDSRTGAAFGRGDYVRIAAAQRIKARRLAWDQWRLQDCAALSYPAIDHADQYQARDSDHFALLAA